MNTPSPLSIVAPYTTRLHSIGACIYCGTAQGPLSAEHIIPLGLSGTLVLPASSCPKCATLTSQFEERVLRGFMKRGRLAMGLRTRHKKRARPTELPTIFIQPDDSLVEKQLPIHEGIQVLHLPVFSKPGFLDAARAPVPSEGIQVAAIDTATFGKNTAEVVREHKAAGVRFEDRLDIWAFVRMLAKIAHAYHVAIKGPFPADESPLLPLIFGKRWDAASWIGNAEDDPLVKPESSALHLMALDELQGDDGSVCSVVRLKLFSTVAGPTYAMATRIQAP